MKFQSVRILTIAAALAATAAFAQEEAPTGLQIQGFVDVQSYWNNKEAKGSYTPALNDAALYINHTMGAHSLTVDLPFSAAVGTGNNFEFATTKAQAFINFGLGENTHLWLGQFDTPFGFELNDSKDLFFSRAGLISSKLMPVTHAGLLLDASVSDFGFKLLASAHANEGRLADNQNPDFGLIASYKASSALSASAGALLQDHGTTKVLYDVLVNWAVSETQALDLEGSFQTESDVDLGWGALVHYTHALNDSWTAGLRGEYLSKVGTGVDFRYSQIKTSIGLNKTINTALKLKADYGMLSAKAAKGADAVISHEVGLGAIYAF